MNETVPTPTVLARWAYSELTTRTEYRNAVSQVLRVKATKGEPFASLDGKEQAALFDAWSAVRGPAFGHMTEFTQFKLQQWNRDDLASVIVHPFLAGDVVSASLINAIRIPFGLWIDAAPVRPLHQSHARYAAIRWASPWRQVDPLLVGRYSEPDELVLVDGYHRAVKFWTIVDPKAEIEVYVPAG